LAETFPEDCGLYTHGHKTHFIQTRVKADLPRFLATVELIDSETLAIQYSDQVLLLGTHNAEAASSDAHNGVDDDKTFAPEANLITSRPMVRVRESWADGGRIT
jgi:hypothetical protein